MKRTLLLTFTAGFLFVTLSSNDNGASGTPNGIQTAKTGCGGAGCHGGAAATGTISVNLVEKSTSMPVTNGEYKPGSTYIVTLASTATGATKYGFIAMFSTPSNTQAGTLANATSAKTKITAKSSFLVAEHSSPMSPVAGFFGAVFEWTAPAKGTGDVTVNVAVNNCNGNGSADAGDTYNLGTATFKEGAPASVYDINGGITVSAYPNPAANTLNVAISNTSANSYQYAIYNINGAVSAKGQLYNNINSIDITALPAGINFLKITDGTSQKVISFNKL
ncbi:MAG: T9SS type A sorting domain-containing protein [Chitinophagaceae bacterium]|nr:T9SS type A sorting domain-containing protein [Chitinophagaceae bacterium]MCB9045622.1 T9SS type A sorting domain-containing protein [Chitinophagales bacterium]